MADPIERPTLRIVRPDEVEAPPVVAPAPTPPLAIVSSKESAELAKAVDVIDASSTHSAALLAAVGAQLADETLEMYHQAATHAPAGTFRRNTPPGMKSAEATRAWINSHATAIAGSSETGYPRSSDLKQAVAFTGSEFDRALSAAVTAGLKFEDRHANALQTATKNVSAIATTPAVEILGEEPQPKFSLFQFYLTGTDVLCAE